MGANLYNLTTATCVALFAMAIAPFSVAQTSNTQAFVGCPGIELSKIDASDGKAKNSLEKLPSAFQVETSKTRRILQGRSANDVVGTGEANESCWARLDGVWQDDSRIRFDDSIEINNWAGDQSKLKNLAHGNYTNTDLIVVLAGSDWEKEITVIDAFDMERSTTFYSSDATPLADVLKIRGPRKTYQAKENTGFGEELILDVDINGFARISVANAIFRRPSPGLLASFENNDFDMSSAFVYNANLDNSVASRSGYDISTADPFDFVGTGKKEVFKEVDGRQYVLKEKRTVPLGFDLIPTTDQGMLYTRTFAKTQDELQVAISAAFGGKARVGANSAIVPGPSGSAGIDVTASVASDMRQSKSSSRAMGYSMTKKYAIVVDHPYIELSNDFRAAIEDARRYGDEDVRKYEEILTKFGTHYPYAVTYGANAELSIELSEEETYERLDIGASVRVEGEVEAVKGAVSGYIEAAGELGTAKNQVNGGEKATFRAVGGNGSWDEKGYAAGERAAPILLDLRPLDELLNPLNYPGQPEVYKHVRSQLRSKIKDYLDLRAAGISKWPIYNTTLEGDFYTGEFPELIFSFTPKSYTESELKIGTIRGSTWDEYAARFGISPPRSPNAQKGVDFIMQRTQSGSYLHPEADTFEVEGLRKLVSRGLASKKQLEDEIIKADHDSIPKGLRGIGKWTAFQDGVVVLEGGSTDVDVPPIKLRQWTDEDKTTVLKNNRFKGGWRSEIWPDFTLLAVENDKGVTRIVFVTEDGKSAALNCIDDSLSDALTAKTKYQIAKLDGWRLLNTDPLNGRYNLLFKEWFSLSRIFNLDLLPEPKSLEDKQRIGIGLCLSSENSPLGRFPTYVIDGRHKGEPVKETIPGMPTLTYLTNGDLKLEFWRSKLKDIRGVNYYAPQYWDALGKSAVLTAIPKQKADALLTKYTETKNKLKAASDPTQ